MSKSQNPVDAFLASTAPLTHRGGTEKMDTELAKTLIYQFGDKTEFQKARAEVVSFGIEDIEGYTDRDELVNLFNNHQDELLNEMALISEGFSGNKAEGIDYIVGNIDGDYSKEEIETALAGANSDDEAIIENRAVIAQWVVWQAATELTANFSEFLETQGNLANKSGEQ